MNDEQSGSNSGRDRFFQSKNPFNWRRSGSGTDEPDDASVEDAALHKRISELLDDIAEPEPHHASKLADRLNLEDNDSELAGHSMADNPESRRTNGVRNSIRPQSGNMPPLTPGDSSSSKQDIDRRHDFGRGVGDPNDILEATGISIKGRGESVAIEIGAGQWQDLIRNLDVRLDQAANFFRGGQVALGVGGRPLLETELSQLWKILERFGLTLGIVRTSSERTFQSAVNLGLTATLDTPNPEQRIEATRADSNRGVQTHFVYRGSLRSGQVLQKSESVLIIGDVNPGGHVISAGDILVWGRLRGVAHAGSSGNGESIIGALRIEFNTTAYCTSDRDPGF